MNMTKAINWMDVQQVRSTDSSA